MKYLVTAFLSLFLAAATAVADTPRQGGSIVYMSGKIPSFNPLHGQYNVGLVSSNIFASLTRLNENNEVSPYLAESYSVSDDGLTYTFNLAKNAKFTTANRSPPKMSSSRSASSSRSIALARRCSDRSRPSRRRTTIP